MKLRFIIGLLAFSLLMLSSLLYFQKDGSFEIISCPSIHSYYKSSENEVFVIEVLTNQSEDYHFSTDYISSSAIQSLDENELIPLHLVEIVKTDTVYVYQNTSYQLMQLSFQIAFDSADYEIEMKEAYLQLQYANNEEVLWKIGEFHYRFLTNQPDDLVIGSIQSTVMKLSNVSTVSGIAIELSNRATENIVIQSIDIGGYNVSTNSFYMTEIDVLPDLFDTPEEVLGISQYDYFEESVLYQKNYLLLEHHTNMLYIPFQYHSKVDLLQRFYIIIRYEVSGETREFVIDDFPYIRTNLFQLDTESEFIRYVYTY